MQAFIRTRYGGPEVLQLKDLPDPEPGDSDVVIRVMASSVNRTDCGFLTGKPYIARLYSGLWKPRFRIMGNEFAGIVESVGSKVVGFERGQRVAGFDDSRFGAHASLKGIPYTAALAVIPDAVDFETAARSTEGAHYALCYIRASGIQRGQSVLVHAGTGAIGSAAIQLMANMGIRVVATAATSNLETVSALGASQVIDYTKEDFTSLPEQFDLVFDAVGKSRFKRCKPILKPQGIYVSTELGPRSENPFLAIATLNSKGKRVLFPIPTCTAEDVAFLLDLVQQQKFKPLLDHICDFNDIPEAFRYVAGGKKNGNVVVKHTH